MTICRSPTTGGEPDPAHLPGKRQLAVRRKPASRQACCGGDEPGSIGTHQRARTPRLLEGRPRAAADSPCESNRGTAAAPLEAGKRRSLIICGIVETRYARTHTQLRRITLE